MASPWLLIGAVCAAAAGGAGGCPVDYVEHPVILVSMDGFRADFINRGLTPTLQALADQGVHAAFMHPAYPSQTFPNHYTIVTGMIPEAHGIISNDFYDPEFGATFSVGSDEALLGRWWGGEPIWNTLTRQGKISATFFWPGSDADIGGEHPSYWYAYNENIPFEARVDQVLEWVSLPVEQRPAWISLYLDEPDHTEHTFGPDSLLVNAKLEYVDRILQRLVDGLTERGIFECVNLIVLADHGMASSVGLPDHVIKLVDYIPDIDDLANIYTGAFPRIDLKNESDAAELDIMSKLACKRDEMRVYRREDLPTRLHFSNNRRIEDIVMDLEPGYVVSVSHVLTNLGNHGYDYYQTTMNALFIATGPEFLQSTVVAPFHNIELYNLMCHLTGVEPAPNNGTLGSLYHILAQPPAYPELPEEERPPTLEFPSGDLGPLLDMAGCEGDLQAPEDWLYFLNFTLKEQQSLEVTHVPWGVPYSGSLPANLTLLYHPDHVTAYSKALKMPLWTSFTVEEPLLGTPVEPWTSDVRLSPDTTQTCGSYNTSLPFNASMYPLFPPVYSRNSSFTRIPYLVSNAVPVSPSLEERWVQLVSHLVSGWVQVLGPLNLILGPVFDNNADSYPDDFAGFSFPEVPSDLFAVVTRCLETVPSLAECPHAMLDADAFIFPQDQMMSNCLESAEYAKEFSAKVHDVEVVTGFTFYPDLSTFNRTTLVLRSHPKMWQSPFPVPSLLRGRGAA
ncbi:venom phosphodiesterase-like [Eriocheir sinensis]|uniref:venom phosphodiesterase-like n=1 Tax=Eriocheir sinensis TaxID=95602 RepID=UPI0021C5F2D7|nr:venom phosphodiesterase-like [Eriocheir sinensis]